MSSGSCAWERRWGAAVTRPRCVFVGCLQDQADPRCSPSIQSLRKKITVGMYVWRVGVCLLGVYFARFTVLLAVVPHFYRMLRFLSWAVHGSPVNPSSLGKRTSTRVFPEAPSPFGPVPRSASRIVSWTLVRKRRAGRTRRQSHDGPRSPAAGSVPGCVSWGSGPTEETQRWHWVNIDTCVFWFWFRFGARVISWCGRSRLTGGEMRGWRAGPKQLWSSWEAAGSSAPIQQTSAERQHPVPRPLGLWSLFLVWFGVWTWSFTWKVSDLLRRWSCQCSDLKEFRLDLTSLCPPRAHHS